MVEFHKKIAELREPVSGLLAKKFEANQACQALAVRVMPRMNELYSQFMIQLRRELSFKLDEDRYAELMKNSTARAVGLAERESCDVQKLVADSCD